MFGGNDIDDWEKIDVVYTFSLNNEVCLSSADMIILAAKKEIQNVRFAQSDRERVTDINCFMI